MTDDEWDGDRDMSALPDWFYPGPRDGWTVDDLETLPPSAPRRLELLDGALIVMSPQRTFHSWVMRQLANSLVGQVPENHTVDTEMVVRLGKRNGPEPDVIVASVPRDRDRTYYMAAEVLLAVEIVSHESEIRDRDVKPRRYAAAGIPYFWRIEEDEKQPGLPVIHPYRLDPGADEYTLVQPPEKVRLRTGVPFPVDIDVPALWA